MALVPHVFNTKMKMRNAPNDAYSVLFQNATLTANATVTIPNFATNTLASVNNAQTFTDTQSFKNTVEASIGAELITNAADRDFSGANNWTGTNWTVGGGVYTHVAGANTASLAGYAAVAGATYVITITMTTTTPGDVYFTYGGGSNKPIYTTLTTYYVTATNAGGLNITPSGTWEGTIDNISIKLLTATSSPVSLLNSSGTVLSSLRGNNTTSVGIGLNALKFSPAAAINNLAIGSDTLSYVTGSGNVAIGTSAMKNAGTAGNNVGLGYNSLYNLSTGSSNVGIGTSAGLGITSGDNNTCIGLNTGYSLTTGYDNSFFGALSGNAITAGQGNTAAGKYALGCTGNCTLNTAFGYRALYNNTGTFTACVALGAYAGRYNTGDYKLYIDCYDRGSSAGELAGAIITGTMSNTVALQTLQFNAACAIGPATDTPYTSFHTTYKNICSGTPSTASADNGAFFVGANIFSAAGRQATRKSGIGGSAIWFDPQTSDTAAAGSFVTNLAADSATPAGTSTIASWTQAGGWTFPISTTHVFGTTSSSNAYTFLQATTDAGTGAAGLSCKHGTTYTNIYNRAGTLYFDDNVTAGKFGNCTQAGAWTFPVSTISGEANKAVFLGTQGTYGSMVRLGASGNAGCRDFGWITSAQAFGDMCLYVSSTLNGNPAAGIIAAQCSSAGAWTFGADTNTTQHVFYGGINSSGGRLQGNTTTDIAVYGVATGTGGTGLYGVGHGTNGIGVQALQSTGAYALYVTGTQYSTSAATFTTSDLRAKENIVPITNSLEKILSLNPVMFDMKNRKQTDPKREGFIAQEFATVFPTQVAIGPEDCVEEPGEKYLAMAEHLSPYLVKAIQEQQAIIEALKADIAILKAA